MLQVRQVSNTLLERCARENRNFHVRMAFLCSLFATPLTIRAMCCIRAWTLLCNIEVSLQDTAMQYRFCYVAKKKSGFHAIAIFPLFKSLL